MLVADNGVFNLGLFG